jgi:hypothetical protein
LGHSYSFMPDCAAVKVRQRPRCWFGSCQTMVSSCPPADVLAVPRVPANPCTAGPCLALSVVQAGWSLTSKLRPPGASLSSQYRPVRGTENPENLSPLGYGPSQSRHTGWRSIWPAERPANPPPKATHHRQWPPHFSHSQAGGQSTGLRQDFVVCSMAVALMPAAPGTPGAPI